MNLGMRRIQIVIQTAILSVASVNQMASKIWYCSYLTIAFEHSVFYILAATVSTKATTEYLVNLLRANLMLPVVRLSVKTMNTKYRILKSLPSVFVIRLFTWLSTRVKTRISAQPTISALFTKRKLRSITMYKSSVFLHRSIFIQSSYFILIASVHIVLNLITTI